MCCDSSFCAAEKIHDFCQDRSQVSEVKSEETQSTDNVHGIYYLRMLRAIRGQMPSYEYDSPSTNCPIFWSVLLPEVAATGARNGKYVNE